MKHLCPRCGKLADTFVISPDLNQKITEQEFEYYKCSSCGLIYLDPIPDDLQMYYGQAYPAYKKAESLSAEASEYDLGKIEILMKYAQGKRLLEIGPGGGTFALLAKNKGFIVDAIEMDENCSKYLTDTIQLHHVINSKDVMGALSKTAESTYDVIVMWHVLEHLEKPWEILRAFPALLSKGGVVIVAVPNPNALQFRILKKFWKHLDAPRHIRFMSIDLIENEFSALGLKKLEISTKDKVSGIFNCYAWWLLSLDNYIRANHRSLIARLLRHQKIAYFIYRVLIEPQENIEGKGNAFLAVFQK